MYVNKQFSFSLEWLRDVKIKFLKEYDSFKKIKCLKFWIDLQNKSIILVKIYLFHRLFIRLR